MITLTITAETADELHSKLGALAQTFCGQITQAGPVPPQITPPQNSFQTEATTVGIDSNDEKPEPKKRGRKPKSQTPPADAAPEAPAADDETTETPEPELPEVSDPVAPSAGVTKDDTVEALKKLNGQHGLEAARAVLEQFGCVRLSELKESDFENFVQACNAKIQG